MKILIRLFDNDRNTWTIQGSTVISHLKSLRHIHKWAQRYVASTGAFYNLNNSKYRLEFYGDNFYGDPSRVIEHV